MKPRNNCGFEVIGITLVTISNGRASYLAEVTYASTTANYQRTLAAEGTSAGDVCQDQLPSDTDSGPNGSVGDEGFDGL